MNGVRVSEEWSDVPFRMGDMIIFNSLPEAVSQGWSLSYCTTPKPENDAAADRPAQEIGFSDCQNDDSKDVVLAQKKSLGTCYRVVRQRPYVGKVHGGDSRGRGGLALIKRLRMRLWLMIKPHGSKALLNFPHRINFNELPPVRVKAKKRKGAASVKLRERV